MPTNRTDRPMAATVLAGGILLALPALVAGPAAGAQESPAARPKPLEELLGRVQERYRTLDDLRARFQQRQVARLGRELMKEGSWLVKMPGRMRVEYDDPPRLFVADGEEMYWYLPEENQVQLLQSEAGDPLHTPTLYLTGEGDLRQDFVVSGVEWDRPLATGNIQVRLDPRSDEARFTHLILEIEPETAMIARLVRFGLLGETTEFRFFDIETDVGLADELFEFDVPPGVDVQVLGGS